MLVNARQIVGSSSDMDRVECLRQILKGIEVEASYDEAQELGASLIEFYEMLAEEAGNDSLN